MGNKVSGPDLIGILVLGFLTLLVFGFVFALITALPFMWFFNYVARYFEFSQISYWIAVCICYVLTIVGGYFKSDGQMKVEL